MHHTVKESQKFVMLNDSDKTVQVFLGLLEATKDAAVSNIARAVIDKTGHRRFDSFSCVLIDSKDTFGINLQGFETQSDRVKFYSYHAEDIKEMVRGLIVENETMMDLFVGQAVRENSTLRGTAIEYAKVFESNDVGHKDYQEIVGSIVSAVVKSLGHLYMDMGASGFLESDFTSEVTNNDMLQSDKGMVYTYLCYEPSSQKQTLAHALVDDSGYEGFIHDARLMDKSNTFLAKDLTALSTRYNRVNFFMRHPNAVKNWIEEEAATDPINTDFNNWLSRIENEDTAHFFSEYRADMDRIIYSEDTQHKYFDEIIDALMLYVVKKVSRDFVYFCKCNGNPFHDDEELTSDTAAIYNKAYLQAKADILKAVQAA